MVNWNKCLKPFLKPGETVDLLIEGRYDRDDSSSLKCVLAATGRGVIFYARKWWGDFVDVVVFPYDTISVLRCAKGVTGHILTIRAPDISRKVERIVESDEDIERFMELVESRRSKSKEEKTAEGPYEKLRELARLRDEGVITEEDFEKAKTAALSALESPLDKEG